MPPADGPAFPSFQPSSGPAVTSSSSQVTHPASARLVGVAPSDYIAALPPPPQTLFVRARNYIYESPPEWLQKLPDVLTVTLLTAVSTGMLKGGRKAGLRFTAENSHRKPRSKEGWYHYRKYKNHAVALGMARESVTRFTKYSSLIITFVLLESFFDHAFLVAKRWRDEDYLARYLVRSYPHVPGGEVPPWEPPRDKEWIEFAKAGASGAMSGGVLCIAGMTYLRFHRPVIRTAALAAIITGGAHGLGWRMMKLERARAAEEAAAAVVLSKSTTMEPKSSKAAAALQTTTTTGSEKDAAAANEERRKREAWELELEKERREEGVQRGSRGWFAQGWEIFKRSL